MKTVTGVSALAVFAGMNREQAERALKFFRSLELTEGQEVFRKGDAGTSMAIIEQGKITVLRNKVAIAILSQGRAFGEITMLDGRPRTATCIATEPAKLILLDGVALRRMSAEAPDLAASLLLSIATSLAGRLRRVDDQLAELVWGETGY
jgi:CRP-like cAMP-binding protein